MSLPVFPSARAVALSGFRAGSLRSVFPRPSSRSGSGFVLVCSFACPRRAGVFAGRWAGRLGVSVSVRRSAGLWSVSVPVAPVWLSVLFVGCLAVSGGLRGFRRSLGCSGLLFSGSRVPTAAPVSRSRVVPTAARASRPGLIQF